MHVKTILETFQTVKVCFKYYHHFFPHIHKIFPDETKVLIATGGETNIGRNTEILDMEDPSFACPYVEIFPVKMYQGVGALVNGTPFICGGYGDIRYGTCYTLEENGKWRDDPVAILNTPRSGIAIGSLTMNDKLVVAGGWDGANRLKTIELVSPNTESMTLPYELPVGLSRSCVVSWGSDSFLMVGGKSNDITYEIRTYFIDMENNKVTNGLDLKIGRYTPVCQEMIVNGISFVVVAGGQGETGFLKSTEVLSKSSVEDGWQPGQIVH